ncbi:MAG: hypothetical protein Q4D16_05865 [Eubacteriales bacterium]|nr:hypothetical protein [Eubacteriales bacterium]
MKLINKLERKFGRFGIPNLTVYIIICYVLGYLIMMLNPNMMYMLSLEPGLILRGQVWRLITWVISPPDTQNVIFFIIAIFFFYYPIGTSLERTWGTFRYTLYIFSGLLFTVIGAFILYFITGGVLTGLGYAMFSTIYISLSIFLAFALSYPDMQVLLMFVIPIKMKWMAIVYAAMIIYQIIDYLRNGVWFMVFPIVASLLNFIIFYFGTRDMSRYNPKEIRRKQEFKKAVSQSRVNPATGGISKHKCAICGRTEKDDPNLEFRFCSKCNGNYEYCQDHLFTHTHVK